MARKIRRTTSGKRAASPAARTEQASPPSGDAGLATESEPASASADESPAHADTGVGVAGRTPLVRSQEIELELGLTLLGGAIGALSGYSQVALDAVAGNVVSGTEGAIIGALLGYLLGRTLFLSVRAQWPLWCIMIVLSYAGHRLAGLAGMVVCAVIATLFVLFGPIQREDDAKDGP